VIIEVDVETNDWHFALTLSVPSGWQGNLVRLLPCAPQWVTQDIEAVRVSRDRLRQLFRPDDAWPADDIDEDEDRADLAWHAAEFEARRSFAYHLFDPEGSRCLGCLYLYPTRSEKHDGEAYLWTRTDLPAGQADAIESEVMIWIASVWSFTALAWPGRRIPFDQWDSDQTPNYYVVTRHAW
jgi:hypothetical protein